MKLIKFRFLSNILLLFIVLNSSNSQWVKISNGMGNLSIDALAKSGNYLFAGTLNHGVYLSTNNGGNWNQTPLNFQRVYALAVNGSYIYAGCAFLSGGQQANFVFISSNYGASWSPPNQYQGYNVISVAVNGNYIFAGSPGSAGVFLSTDNGNSWNLTSSGISNSIPSLLVNGNKVFAGTGSAGVYLSTNNGINWTQTSLNNRNVKSLAANGNNIFAGTTNYGMYISADNGTSWIQTSLNNQSVISLAVNGSNIFAGTIDSGVFSFTGANWSQCNEGLGNVTINALCIFNNYIFAGTNDSGIYRRPLGELTGFQPISNKVPNHFTLSQNYPNPFNPATKINFSLPKSSYTKLIIYDITGKVVQTLVNEQLEAASYEKTFDASGLCSGIYFYKIEAEGFSSVKKMILLK